MRLADCNRFAAVVAVEVIPPKAPVGDMILSIRLRQPKTAYDVASGRVHARSVAASDSDNGRTDGQCRTLSRLGDKPNTETANNQPLCSEHENRLAKETVASMHMRPLHQSSM